MYYSLMGMGRRSEGECCVVDVFYVDGFGVDWKGSIAMAVVGLWSCFV